MRRKKIEARRETREGQDSGSVGLDGRGGSGESSGHCPHRRDSIRTGSGRGGGFYRRWGKSSLDLIASSLTLLALLPVVGGVALLVRLTHGRPLLFRQKRPGLGGRPFNVLKFRTMTESKDDKGNLLPDHMRLTRLGRLLRRTSLDEFPEFVNVLKGEMSLVGPRPLLMEYLERYTPEQARRHEVMPGISGWAQVNGRNALTWDEKFKFDVWYVDHMSFRLDLKILAMTFWKVITGEGISRPGHVTMPVFKGNGR